MLFSACRKPVSGAQAPPGPVRGPKREWEPHLREPGPAWERPPQLLWRAQGSVWELLQREPGPAWIFLLRAQVPERTFLLPEQAQVRGLSLPEQV